PLTPGLSYCNRCGASLRERSESKSKAIPAFLIAITLIAMSGLGIMLGGALALRDADMAHQIIGFFMLFTFIIVLVTELLLVKQLSRLTGNVEHTAAGSQANLLPVTETRSFPARTPGEPVSSVTENTTRTLEYSRNQS
ncbi:MAG TPA: hypothetical protein VIT88_11680, partial [Pyrinomonadaceae bacterium]